MTSFHTDKFTYLNYTDMDAEMSRRVWACRNLPEIRRYMVNQEIIPFEAHCNFVEKLKSNSRAAYFNVLKEGHFIGSVNLHLEDERTAERGIYLNPEYQGQGLSKEICRDFYQYVRDNCGLRCITTKVMKENVSSNALERSLGAKLEREDDRFYHYRLSLDTL